MSKCDPPQVCEKHQWFDYGPEGPCPHCRAIDYTALQPAELDALVAERVMGWRHGNWHDASRDHGPAHESVECENRDGRVFIGRICFGMHEPFWTFPEGDPTPRDTVPEWIDVVRWRRLPKTPLKWSPSTRIADAWEVVERMKELAQERHRELDLDRPSQTLVWMNFVSRALDPDDWGYENWIDEMFWQLDPRAICIAALRATEEET